MVLNWSLSTNSQNFSGKVRAEKILAVPALSSEEVWADHLVSSLSLCESFFYFIDTTAASQAVPWSCPGEPGEGETENSTAVSEWETEVSASGGLLLISSLRLTDVCTFSHFSCKPVFALSVGKWSPTELYRHSGRRFSNFTVTSLCGAHGLAGCSSQSRCCWPALVVGLGQSHACFKSRSKWNHVKAIVSHLYLASPRVPCFSFPVWSTELFSSGLFWFSIWEW